MNEPTIGFELRKRSFDLQSILPVRQIADPQKQGRYKAILSSIKEVGLIEPLTVYPSKDCADKFLLLDGHLRYFALKELGIDSADCIISRDDEAFTYNARVNRLAPLQEHRMILKAVRNGVKPERIAAALDIPLKQVNASLSLLDGINEEAAELLKQTDISAYALRLLRKVTGVRQIEIAELMISVNNFSSSYAEALVLGTRKGELANPEKRKRKKGVSAEEIARMEEEMAGLERDLRAVEESYGENMLKLTPMRAYIKKLLENPNVMRHLSAYHGEILTQFEVLAAADAL